MKTGALVGALALAFVAGPAAADPCHAQLPTIDTFSGPVIFVIDGDSLCVDTGLGDLVEVRVHGFDAPELGEPGGAEARAILTVLTLGRDLDCAPLAISFDRVVADCALDGDPLPDRLIPAPVWPPEPVGETADNRFLAD